MELTFSRSGGFAALPLGIGGKVTFQGKVARVTSEGGYQRDLTPDEIRTLQTAAANLPEKQSAGGPGQLRDAYQYDIRITRDDGRTQELVAHGESSAEMDGILDWVRSECDRIWAHKTRQRGQG
jgi:hypothetical protein